MRASIQCDITLSGVRLPADAVLPGATGLKGPFSCLNEARYGIMWGAMGAARDAYEAALAYALQRRQFGQPIASFQLTQHKLVDMVLEIQKGLLVAAADRAAQGRRQAPPGADLLRQAQQRPRGHHDLPVGPHDPRRQRHHPGPLTATARQQPRSVRTYEGTDEVHTLIMGRAITGIPAFS